jgi:hypothetical protein
MSWRGRDRRLLLRRSRGRRSRTSVGYVTPWRGFVHVEFAIDRFARMMVGWRASSSVRTNLTLILSKKQSRLDPILKALCITATTASSKGGAIECPGKSVCPSVHECPGTRLRCRSAEGARAATEAQGLTG